MSVIDNLIKLVEQGRDPADVIESVVFSAGSEMRVSNATTATDVATGASVAIPAGTLVVAIGAGAGSSGADQMVKLPDGSVVSIPFEDLEM